MALHEEAVNATANRLVRKLLLNTSVESFGIMHQMPLVHFRNEHGNDMVLCFDSPILFHPEHGPCTDSNEYLLIGMNRVNLKMVVDATCTAASDLEVYFEDGSWFRISGTSEDGNEPWQLSDGLPVDEDGTLIIAQTEGGYAIWNGSSIDKVN
ncbi:hypothetical protein MUN82_14020 [Hymenobacter aerilatus]|uniref:Uncharacterized protein n=1 Tax=Hymenobacter aerilatus TaxID=2932251 RepID=A0A8T9SPJ3_9BACT|nr:hypothetical protein [Hymenobacter aerilatus]UOR04058.1 hypothetical protein MUN82_14020 [Hymenobacter aerilatus]